MNENTEYQKWLKDHSNTITWNPPKPRPWKVTVDNNGNRYVYESEEDY